MNNILNLRSFNPTLLGEIALLGTLVSPIALIQPVAAHPHQQTQAVNFEHNKMVSIKGSSANGDWSPEIKQINYSHDDSNGNLRVAEANAVFRINGMQFNVIASSLALVDYSTQNITYTDINGRNFEARNGGGMFEIDKDNNPNFDSIFTAFNTTKMILIRV